MSGWYEEDALDPYRVFWEVLANAIVLEAVKDYRKTLRQLKRRPDNRELLRMKRSCEGFFFSRWFRMLTAADPAAIVKGIWEEEAV